MRYGFIGAGNMAQTMIKGFINNNALQPNEIFIYDIDQQKQRFVSNEYGVISCSSLKDISTDSHVLVLAIKPDQLADLLKKFPFSENKPTLISLPVGISMERIREYLGFDMPIVRIIPNISAEIFASVTAFCVNNYVLENNRNSIKKTLESLGTVVELPENHLDIFTVIASSAPAFVIKFAESLAEAALKEGIPKEIARNIITDMLLGTAKMLKEHEPYSLTDRICSPGGTTIVGLTSLTAHGFEAAVHAAAADCMMKLKK